MWDRVQAWLEKWGTSGIITQGRIVRRAAGDRPPRISEAEARQASAAGLVQFHRGHRDLSTPLFERVIEALPVGDPDRESAVAHLDAAVTGVSCSCPLRDRVTALLGSEPSLHSAELRAGTDLIVEVGEAVTAAVTEAGLHWNDLHYAGSFGDTELYLAVGGELAADEEQRAGETLARFLHDQHLEGLVTIER